MGGQFPRHWPMWSGGWAAYGAQWGDTGDQWGAAGGELSPLQAAGAEEGGRGQPQHVPGAGGGGRGLGALRQPPPAPPVAHQGQLQRWGGERERASHPHVGRPPPKTPKCVRLGAGGERPPPRTPSVGQGGETPISPPSGGWRGRHCPPQHGAGGERPSPSSPYCAGGRRPPSHTPPPKFSLLLPHFCPVLPQFPMLPPLHHAACAGGGGGREDGGLGHAPRRGLGGPHSMRQAAGRGRGGVTHKREHGGGQGNGGEGEQREVAPEGGN